MINCIKKYLQCECLILGLMNPIDLSLFDFHECNSIEICTA